MITTAEFIWTVAPLWIMVLILFGMLLPLKSLVKTTMDWLQFVSDAQRNHGNTIAELRDRMDAFDNHEHKINVDTAKEIALRGLREICETDDDNAKQQQGGHAPQMARSNRIVLDHVVEPGG